MGTGEKDDCRMSGKYKTSGLSSENDIHILTPCGGRGNCAKCKVRILKGEAKINTMDQIRFSQKELDEGYRLGCQVFAKEPLAIEIYEK